MGYRAPNIDRSADKGMRFTGPYGEQSCTAGRAAFITGQSVYRTGLSKVGMPGATVRAASGGPDDRRPAEAARVRHRPVREEPPGPLTKKRMETIGDEILAHALDFIDRKRSEGAPWFMWFNTTHMHLRTHPNPRASAKRDAGSRLTTTP
jgi:arylsulfatase A-like enzyme